MTNPTPSAPVYTPAGIVKSITHTVPSATEPGTVYHVAVNLLSMRSQSCDCLGSAYGKLCWHRKLVNDGKCPCKPHIVYGPRLTVPGADLYA